MMKDEMENRLEDLESRVQKLERLIECLQTWLLEVRPVISLPLGYELDLLEERNAILKILAEARK